MKRALIFYRKAIKHFKLYPSDVIYSSGNFIAIRYDKEIVIYFIEALFKFVMDDVEQ